MRFGDEKSDARFCAFCHNRQSVQALQKLGHLNVSQKVRVAQDMLMIPHHQVESQSKQMHKETQSPESTSREVTQTQDVLGSFDEFLNRHTRVVKVEQVSRYALLHS